MRESIAGDRSMQSMKVLSATASLDRPRHSRRAVGVPGRRGVLVILHEEFSRWFGADTAGPREACEEPASRMSSSVELFSLDSEKSAATAGDYR